LTVLSQSRARVLLLTALIAGCGAPCTQVEVVGDYELRSHGDRFELQLSADGKGRLARNGELIESLSWQYEPADTLIFLNVSSASTQTLDALKYTNLLPPDDIHWNSAHYGLSPECTHSGVVRRLGLNLGGPPYFVRVR
jgi:hypothetical protein